LSVVGQLEVVAVADSVPARLQALVIASAGLGLRQGEACGLHLPQIDFLRRKATIDRQLVTPNVGKPKIGPPKTQASVRTIPLPDVVGKAIAKHVEDFGTGKDGLLFGTVAGDPLRRQRWEEIFKAAAEKAEVAEVTPHDLRHHAASLLIARGCSVKAVQHFLGHATAAETLDTYGHLWADDEDRIRDSIDAAFSAPETILRPPAAADGA
jgi:integrase